MSYQNTKTTSRFQFGIVRNPTAKKAGSNMVTIATRPFSGQYAVGTTQLSLTVCLLYTSPSPRDGLLSRMPSSA